MKTPMTWLLGGAALTLCAGVTVAIAAEPSDPAAVVRQAQEDARSAEADARTMHDDARRSRDRNRDVRVYRGDRDSDAIVMRGGGRDETLSRLLQLRPEQQPALKAFLEATRSSHDHGRDHMVRFNREGDGRTTLQRLDEMQARAAGQKAEMDRKVAAIKSFYGQLDARQKQAFDAMPMLMMVGPMVGPMMIPRPMPIAHRVPPVPPIPPAPPVPPARPRS